MKTTCFIAALSFVTLSASAQKLKESEVPAVVKESFAKKFPGVTAEKWEKDGTDFEVEFDMNHTESAAVFEANGTYKQLEQEIKESLLPKGVMEYCKAHFAGYKLDEAEKITNAAGKTSFEAELKNEKEHFDAAFDEAGNFVSKSALKPNKAKKE